MSSSVTFYEHIDYQGASITVDDDIASMPSGWNDRVSSARVNCPIALFQRTNYGGDVVVLNEDTPNFRNIRGLNFDDRLSSVRLRSMHMKLNNIVGVYRGSLSHSFDHVREQVARTNDAFGPYGIYFDPGRITVAPRVRDPISSERQMRILEDGFLRSDMMNCLFFKGGMWRPETWRWNVRSIRLDASPGWTGSLGVDLYDATDFGGNALTFNTNQPTLPASHSGNVRSIRLHSGTVCTAFALTNYMRERHIFRSHARDLNEYAYLKDWWKGKGGHCCGWGGKLARVSGNNTCILGQELGHWFGLDHRPGVGNMMSSQEPCNIEFDQAESCWKFVMASSSRQALFDFLP